MRIPLKLSFYIIRIFLLNIAIVFLVFAAITCLNEAFELTRKAQNKEVPFSAIIQMVFLRFPLIAQKMMPFVTLIATVLTYRKLSNTSELVAIRSAGISVWEFVLPAFITAFLMGVLVVTVINPLSAVMISRHERLEAKFLHGRDSYLSISSNGLWLRQSNAIYTSDKDDKGEVIIYAQNLGQMAESGSNIILNDVTFFVYATKDKFYRRMDAKQAELLEDFWRLTDVIITTPDGLSNKISEYFLNTDLNVRDIHNSFASPDTISFWSLPGFIDTLKKSGFSALAHRLQWHSVLVSPFFYSAMVLIAVLFSLRPPRQGKVGLLITGSIVTGFVIYFMSNLVSSLGLSGSIPVFLAAWAPSGVSMLIGISLLLHFEDG